jgi:hypothetical protein
MIAMVTIIAQETRWILQRNAARLAPRMAMAIRHHGNNANSSGSSNNNRIKEAGKATGNLNRHISQRRLLPLAQVHHLLEI